MERGRKQEKKRFLIQSHSMFSCNLPNDESNIRQMNRTIDAKKARARAHTQFNSISV